MKKLVILALFFGTVTVCTAQRRTIVIPAPQPPGVPIDGGLTALLIGGGLWGRKFFNKTKN